MHLLLAITTAFANLRANKLRTALTMLGIIIGVSTVIVMVAIVEGARFSVVQEFERLGSHLILIAFQPERTQQRRRPRLIENLDMDDVRAIRAQCPLLKHLSAETQVGGQVVARYRDREMDVLPRGVESGYNTLRNYTMDRGRFITEEDMLDWNKICVLGAEVRRQIFPNEDPLGQDIELKGVTVTVVGVLEKKGRSGSGGLEDDRSVLMPISTVHKRFTGKENVGIIFAQPRDTSRMEQAMDQVWECLMRRHNNDPGLRVDSQENILNTIGRVLNIFGLVMGGIAGLALLVGGIGIMNIMLVSVTERTREIGIRKAVGAKRRDILWQFLVEAATVSGLGGLMGIGLGGGVAWIIGKATVQLIKEGPGGAPGLTVHLPLWAILSAFLFSAFVGVFFGIYPAMRAASLDPIEALRHE